MFAYFSRKLWPPAPGHPGSRNYNAGAIIITCLLYASGGRHVGKLVCVCAYICDAYNMHVHVGLECVCILSADVLFAHAFLACARAPANKDQVSRRRRRRRRHARRTCEHTHTHSNHAEMFSRSMRPLQPSSFSPQPTTTAKCSA